jgi:hypothetical protein
MKKRVLTLIGSIIGFFAFTSHLQAQTNNLYFNQVILVGNTTMTVPAGKVWKVVGYMQGGAYFANRSGGTGCGSTNNFHGFYVNGVLYGLPYSPSLSYSTAGWGSEAAAASLPLWLPAGTTLRTECANDFLSVIEFNVAP